MTPALDGVEAGLLELTALGGRGVRLLNRPAALLAAHDKRETTLRLTDAGIPHPRTLHRKRLDEVRALDLPFVLKPRFGSWGRDVMLCRDADELERCLTTIRERSWFHRHGVLIQELLPPLGYDLRVIVAGERVVGAERREAARGEWRTDEILGGRVCHAHPSKEARALAVDAARAVGADLVGVDLLPLSNGGYAVVELNSAVDFDVRDSLPGRSIYVDVADALALDRQIVPALDSCARDQLARRMLRKQTDDGHDLRRRGGWCSLPCRCPPPRNERGIRRQRRGRRRKPRGREEARPSSGNSAT